MLWMKVHSSMTIEWPVAEHSRSLNVRPAACERRIMAGKRPLAGCYVIKLQFAAPSPGHRRLQCRGSEPCFRAWCARAGAGPPEDSSSAGRSGKPLCAASYRYHTRYRQVQSRRPNDVRAGHIVASTDAAKHAPDLEKDSRRTSTPRPDPGFEALACLLRYLELYWPLRLLLRDCCPGSNMTAWANILHLQPRQIARPQLAVDHKVENCQFTNVRSHLKPRPNRPDLSELQRRLLPGKFALVPRHTMTGRWVLGFHDNLLSIEGRSSLRSFGRTLTDPLPPHDTRKPCGSCRLQRR